MITPSLPLAAPASPRIRLSLGITGHRAAHAGYTANLAAIEVTVGRVLDVIALAVADEPVPFGAGSLAPVRMHSMLADGADQLVAREALKRGWDLVAPLPFGMELNLAINAAPRSADDALRLIQGDGAADPEVLARAGAIRGLCEQAQVFELADDDADIERLFLATFAGANAVTAHEVFAADSSERVALAARIVIEQSDFMIAIWDGARTTFVGGTGHTIKRALEHGAAVVWIDPAAPEDWQILYAPEALASLRVSDPGADRLEQLGALVRQALRPMEPNSKANHSKSDHAKSGPSKGDHPGVQALAVSRWRATSNASWHAYRRVEALFGGVKGSNPFRSLRQTYEPPEAIQTGSGAGVMKALTDLPGADASFDAKIGAGVLARFAWADGISSSLSDTYRGGMMINFFLSSFAIVGGMAYFPFADSYVKWAFALFEFVLLSLILIITWQGQKKRWHGRWFETRRVAEYLRHAPLLLALGAARPPGRWPKGAETSWPEWYARHALREVGLPRTKVTAAYLRHALQTLLDTHVTQQRDYHHGKARRLTAVHHNLDALSEWMFRLAVLSVAIYLCLQTTVWAGGLDKGTLKEMSKVFTFLGVMLPTFGGAIAGIRYFGDFERFAAISEVTSQKLDAVHARISLLLKAADSEMDYGPVSELAHAADEIVVSEIENWQAVFGGKHITVPV
jgi:hypothetical protein